jgi:Transcription factor WhiB
MARYRSWGLEVHRDTWWQAALCRGRAQMFFTRNSDLAAQATHLCQAHCPVLRSCRREAEHLTPVGAVQAGTWYADATTHAAGPRKRQPTELGCGPWRAHLRQPANTEAKP